MLDNFVQGGKPYDAFEGWCEVNDIGNWEVVVLVAYFDESYNQRTEKRADDPLLYTVSCSLSPKDEWTKLKARWNSALHRKPRIEFFHMTDFDNRMKPYDTWSEPMRLERLQRLHEIMRDHIKYNITGTVNRTEFDAVARVRRHKKQPQLDYYLFDTIVCMNAVAQWCDRNNYNDRVHYIFSHLDTQGSLLDMWFSYCLERPQLRKHYRLAATWGKGRMKDVAQLQAADIVAYELNKRAVNYIAGGEQYIRKSFENLQFSPYTCEPQYFGSEEIDHILGSKRVKSFGLTEGEESEL